MKALGSGLGVQVAVVVGGVDMMTQTLVLAKKPHVVIGEEGGDRGGVMIKLYRVSFSYSRTISGSPGEY